MYINDTLRSSCILIGCLNVVPKLCKLASQRQGPLEVLVDVAARKLH